MSLYSKLFEQGKFERSEKKCRQALSRNPSDNDARRFLVLSLLELGKYQDAASVSLKAARKVKMTEAYKALFLNLAGDALRRLDRLTEALECYVEANGLQPDQPENIFCRMWTYFHLNMLEECLSVALESFECPNPPNDDRFSMAVYYFARCSDRTAEDLFAVCPRARKLVAHEYFHAGMAELYEREGDFKKAFEHFSAGNLVQRARSGFDIQGELGSMRNARTVFDESFFGQPGFEWEKSNPVPIFVVGMPRSGSSMLEQMLGLHSEIEPLGEVNWLASFARQNGRERKNFVLPDLKEKLSDRGFCKQIRDNYLERIRDLDVKYTVDKLLGNIQLLWLIRRVFPEAFVLHMRRDKWPNVWSCFRSTFDVENNFSESLADCSLYYDEVMVLADTWGPMMDRQFVEVGYEQFVRNPRQGIDSVLEHLGLETQEQCYDPSRSDRIVKTVSRIQVMKPVYADANSSWQNYKGFVEAELGSLDQA